jgi:hypothetical protein
VPDEHAPLSPSASERWTSCPASVRVAASFPKSESSFAAEGTHFHSLAEHKASLVFGYITDYDYAVLWRSWLKIANDAGYDVNEMVGHAEEWVELLQAKAEEHPGTQVLLERRVHTGIEGCWGTADAVLVSPTHVEIVDAKYGKGVPVSPVRNPQLMLYGVGALEEYGDLLGEVEHVTVSVFQPRLRNSASYTIDPDELRAWRDSLIPVAADALAGSDVFGPSESACRWCPAAGSCKPRMTHMLDADFPDLTDDAMSADELAAALARLPEIKQWVAAVEDRALHAIYSEDLDVPGWKVVLSGGKRVIRDPDAARAALLAEGYVDADFMSPPKLLGITAIDKLVGKGNTADILGAALERTEGSPSLAPADDPRPPANRNADAAQTFGDLL